MPVTGATRRSRNGLSKSWTWLLSCLIDWVCATRRQQAVERIRRLTPPGSPYADLAASACAARPDALPLKHVRQPRHAIIAARFAIAFARVARAVARSVHVAQELP